MAPREIGKGGRLFGKETAVGFGEGLRGGAGRLVLGRGGAEDVGRFAQRRRTEARAVAGEVA